MRGALFFSPPLPLDRTQCFGRNSQIGSNHPLWDALHNVRVGINEGFVAFYGGGTHQHNDPILEHFDSLEQLFGVVFHRFILFYLNQGRVFNRINKQSARLIRKHIVCNNPTFGREHEDVFFPFFIYGIAPQKP